MEIVRIPNPILSVVCEPIESINDKLRDTIAQMCVLMHEMGGVGLAAPQVGLRWRMFIANQSGEIQDDAVFINPVIHFDRDEKHAEVEGCLSLPSKQRYLVERYVHARIVAQNSDGESFERSASDFEARIWQHEMDHLNGILISDKGTLAEG